MYADKYMHTNSKVNTVLLALILIVLIVGGYVLLRNWDVTQNEMASLPSREYSSDVTSAAGQTGSQPVSGESPQKPAQLDMSNPYAQEYRTRFAAEFTQSANFDGHFRLVDIGCGSSCFTLYALDLATGKTYKLAAGQNYVITGNTVEITLQSGQKQLFTFNKTTGEFIVQ